MENAEGSGERPGPRARTLGLRVERTDAGRAGLAPRLQLADELRAAHRVDVLGGGRHGFLMGSLVRPSARGELGPPNL